MTALLLTAQKIVPYISIKNHIAEMQDIFFAVNARGLLTMAASGLMALGIAGYIALVGHSFNLGIQLRAAGNALSEEERAVKNLDVALREREANFSVRYQAALEGMDKVSAVIYLESGSVAMR